MASLQQESQGLEACRARLASGAKPDLIKRVKDKLFFVLTHQSKCRDDLLILSLEACVAQKWIKQLDESGSTRVTCPETQFEEEDEFRGKLISALKYALSDHCNAVFKQ
jgi:hypothetical protein